MRSISIYAGVFVAGGLSGAAAVAVSHGGLGIGAVLAVLAAVGWLLVWRETSA